MRVLLIQPTAQGGAVSLLAHEQGAGIGCKPPMGLLGIATHLAVHGFEVRILDALALGFGVEQTVREAIQWQPDVIGVSAWSDYWYCAHRTASELRKALPNAHVVIGGPHVGIYPEETLQSGACHSIVAGDGESPMLHLCRALEKGVPPNHAGLHLAGAAVSESATRLHIEDDLDAIGYPDRRLLDHSLYGSVLGKGRPLTTMMTSRGCPNRCTFCKLDFQKPKFRSAESVVAEFCDLASLGFGEVEIYDDTFTWSRERVEAICRGLIRENTGITWAIRDRVNRADADLLRLMHEAGCRRVHYGVESGVDRMLREMKKGITTEQARNAVRLAKEAGMTVLTYFMFGGWSESAQDMEQTIRLALELDADYCEFSILIPYAGTELYRTALREGAIATDYWREHALNPKPNFRHQVIERNLNLAELAAMRDKAVRSFYFRPRYMLRQLRAVGSPGELARKARMGFDLLRATLGRGAK